MDQARQLRFAIPPFFLFASLLWGAHIGGVDLSPILEPGTTKEILGVIAATAVALVPIGFVTSTLSINLLRLGFWLSGKPTYEAVLDDDSFATMWRHIDLPGEPDRAKSLYVAATFDHECLTSGVHQWLFRRWTSFNLAAHSAVAVILAHVAAPIFHVPQTCGWTLTTVLLLVLFTVTGRSAWFQVMEMLRLQARRTQYRETTQSSPGAESGPTKG